MIVRMVARSPRSPIIDGCVGMRATSSAARPPIIGRSRAPVAIELGSSPPESLPPAAVWATICGLPIPSLRRTRTPAMVAQLGRTTQAPVHRQVRQGRRRAAGAGAVSRRRRPGEDREHERPGAGRVPRLPPEHRLVRHRPELPDGRRQARAEGGRSEESRAEEASGREARSQAGGARSCAAKPAAGGKKMSVAEMLAAARGGDAAKAARPSRGAESQSKLLRPSPRPRRRRPTGQNVRRRNARRRPRRRRRRQAPQPKRPPRRRPPKKLQPLRRSPPPKPRRRAEAGRRDQSASTARKCRSPK